MPSATAEHSVMSFIPYLSKPPTHTQTGTLPPSQTPAETSFSENSSDMATAVRTKSEADPYGPRQWHSNLIKLTGKNRALNEFSVERSDEQTDENLVMLHGYGAGLGFFYKNFEGLSRVPGWNIYALDLLGMGRSSRPPFRLKSKDRQACITEAEDWFIDALEEWRVQKRMDRFTLLGHSLGGYLAVAYALKYPGHLNKLVLASPVGIPEDPYAVSAELPEPNESTMANEFTQDQEEGTKIAANTQVADNNNFLNARSKRETADRAGDNKLPPRRTLPKWLTVLWDANVISPFTFVRWSGPLGPRLVSGWTSRRFSHLGEEESKALHTYAYSLFKMRGSGEYAVSGSRTPSSLIRKCFVSFALYKAIKARHFTFLETTSRNVSSIFPMYLEDLVSCRAMLTPCSAQLSYILAPGAFARSPLIRRIGGVGRQYLQPDGSTTSTADPATRKREHGLPIILMYGENDWMDVAGGYAAEQKLKEEKEQALKTATAEERRQENGSAKVVVIKQAGHHVYLDGWEEFNEVMRGEMEETSKRSKGS